MKVTLTMAAMAIAGLAIAGCGGSVGNSTQVSGAAGASGAVGNPCQALAVWQSGGGTKEMTAVESDLAKVVSAAQAQSLTALATAGQALDNDAANAALDLPPIDGLGYTNSMTDFQAAGTHFSSGIQSDDQAGEAPLQSATKEINNFSASVKATCH
jgi:hypothetical protein